MSRIVPPPLGPQTVPILGVDQPRDEWEHAQNIHHTPNGCEAVEVGHYDVLEPLGRGGFGVVMRAFDRKLCRVVAIKMMNEEMAATSPARKRFLREARSGAAINHDNVVRIYAVEELPIPHIVMEYISGVSLEQHLLEHGPLAIAEALRLGAQIARGLAAAHDQGVIHRDVKPANVMLEGDGKFRAKLMDFGLARTADDANLTQSGTVLGTPMYMSPEQARGEEADHRSDLFSLGSVLYVMISGRPPFRAPNSLAVLKRVADDTARPIHEIIPETPNWLCDIIDKLHERDPDKRFQSAAEVAELLEQCLAEWERGEKVRLPHNVGRKRRVPWLGAMTATLALAAVVVAGISVLNSPSVPPHEPAPPAPEAVAVVPSPPVEVVPAQFTNTIGMEFVRVPAGSSMLDGGRGVQGTRPVDITQDYFMGKYEVTRAEWEAVMGKGTDPSRHSRVGSGRAAIADVSDEELRRFPVESVSWLDCQEFIRRLNQKEKNTGWVYRLPTNTEWEYACRGGPERSANELGCDFYAGEPSNTLTPDRANSAHAGIGRPCPVGSFPPNGLGIHDQHGNVFEHLDDFPQSAPMDHLIAGGYWEDQPGVMRAVHRSWLPPTNRYTGAGFRLVRVSVDAPPTPRQLTESVTAELKRLNPQFTGALKFEIHNDRITLLIIEQGNTITDITPIRELRDLEWFELEGSQCTDLSPLRGLPLRHLWLNNTWTIRDLEPLRGMKLEKFAIWGFTGNDLSPLAGMPLKYLNCGGGGQKLDLSPLKGIPMEYLCVNATQVDDLSPLAGMPMEELSAEHTLIRDVSPLRGMKLKRLHILHSPVTDITPLRGMPLEWLDVDYIPEQHAEIVCTLPTLTTINKVPAAEFWAKFTKE